MVGQAASVVSPFYSILLGGNVQERNTTQVLSKKNYFFVLGWIFTYSSINSYPMRDSFFEMKKSNLFIQFLIHSCFLSR